MGLTANSAILGFGPQSGKGVNAASWYRHRASMVDLAIIDPVQEGAPEIGGVPVPGFMYKSGPVSSGSFVIQPRLEDTLGWLLYGGLGNLATSPTGTVDDDRVVADGNLAVEGALSILLSPATPSRLLVTPANLSGPAVITIAGTDTADAVITETVTIPDATAIWTKKVFKTVTGANVDVVPVAGASGSTGTVDIGSATGSPFVHTFTLKGGDESYVPWMGFRKYIPKSDGTPGTDMGEQYNDCKVLGMTMSLAADAPLSMRVDVLGREFQIENDPSSWVWANGYEDWQSIPVGCAIDGYLKFDGEDLPVIAAQVGFANVPLDLRQERVYGDPMLNDITIVQRRLTYDFTVKWKNPELYRRVLTGSVNGSTWNPAPQSGSFDVRAVSSTKMTGKNEPWALNISADQIVLGMAGGIQLASNQSVLMRFVGMAVDSAEYCRFELKNLTSGYTWPV